MPPPPIFHDVKYFIHPSVGFEEAKGLINSLRINGAAEAETIGEATHVITETEDLGGEKRRNGAYMVTPKWVTRCVVLGLKQEERFYSASTIMIFSGVVGCASDLPPRDVEVMQAGIVGFGGQWRGHLTREVTHLFVLSASGEKYMTALRHKGKTEMKILLPHWFDDSFKSSHLVPTDPYEFPSPSLLAYPPADRLEQWKPSVLQNQFYRSLTLARPSGDLSRIHPKHRDIFGQKKVKLSLALGMDPNRTSAFESRLLAGGAIVEDDLTKADILITPLQKGEEFFEAVRLKKTIGTLEWVVYVLREGKLSSPREQLMHYPHPPGPCGKFAEYDITVSNYSGAARDYVKLLIETLGGKFTPTMSGTTTHVIAGQCLPNGPVSAKIARAEEWGVPVLNHLWLEDCFADWKEKNIHGERYARRNVEWSAILGDRREVSIQVSPARQRDRDVPIEPLGNKMERWLSSGMEAQPGFQQPARPAAEKERDVDMDGIEVPQDEAEVERVISSSNPAPSIAQGSVGPLVPRSPVPESSPRPRPSSSKRPLAPSSLEAGPRKRARNSSPVEVLAITSSSSLSRSPSPVPLNKSQPRPRPRNTNLAAKKAIVSDSTNTTAVAAAVEDTSLEIASYGRVRRTAAIAASSKLSAIMPDANMYEREMKGRRKSGGLSNMGKIRGAGEYESDEEMEDAQDATEIVPPKKISKSASLQESKENALQDRRARGPMPHKNSVKGKGKGKGPPGKRVVQRDDESDSSVAILEDAPVPVNKGKGKRRQSIRAASDDGSDEDLVPVEPEPPRPANRALQKLNSQKPARGSSSGAPNPSKRKVKLITTQVTIAQADMQKLEAMGVQFVQDSVDCTHLVARSISRTEKFLCALPHCPYILSQEWVNDSLSKGHLLPESGYHIVDEENESKYTFKLSDALERAKLGKLLKGHTFYITPSVKTPFKTMKKLIEANGGEVVRATQPPARALEMERRHLISCEADDKMWRPCAAKGLPIYSQELILTGCLKQQLDWEEDACRVPGSLSE